MCNSKVPKLHVIGTRDNTDTPVIKKPNKTTTPYTFNLFVRWPSVEAGLRMWRLFYQVVLCSFWRKTSYLRTITVSLNSYFTHTLTT